jgi:hypothetical protein
VEDYFVREKKYPNNDAKKYMGNLSHLVALGSEGEKASLAG